MMSGVDWFILRCAGRSTLSLAKTLGEDGYAVWTPARTQLIRVPRMNVRREVRLPLLPSFVFAQAHHLHDLLDLSQRQGRRDPNGGRQSRPAHRDFSVFHHLDQIPMVADHHLEPLRASERQAAPKKDAPRFDRGAKVNVNSGAFAGLKGRVEHCKSGYALVIFTDFKRPVKIPTWLLDEKEVINPVTPARREAA